jgi:uncharacterized membrane protein
MNIGSIRRKEILRGILAVSLIIVGITHFLSAEQYARIVPPVFPAFPSVYISGFFEILGGIGLLIPWLSVYCCVSCQYLLGSARYSNRWYSS